MNHPNPRHPSGAALNVPLSRPDIRVGDEWVFVTRAAEEVERGATGLVMSSRVAEIGPDGRIRIRVWPEDRPESDALVNVYSDQFDLLSREVTRGEAVEYSPAFPHFRFPMRPGEAWQTTVEQIQPAWDLHAKVGVSVAVEAEEAVQVPAGRFAALRLAGHYTTGEATVTAHYWYAPAAGRSVRGVEDTVAINGSRVRVIYELKSLNRLRA